MKFLAERDLSPEIYPAAKQPRITVASVHAARIVRDLNFKYMQEGRGATSDRRRSDKDGITIGDPNRFGTQFETIYKKPI